MLERTIHYSKKLNENDHLLGKDKHVHESIVRHAMQYYEIDQDELDRHIQAAEKEGRAPAKQSVGQALKHLIRDWSGEGEVEHDDSFPCVINSLLEFSERTATTLTKVLLPGSGLGRLGHDIHSLGGTSSLRCRREVATTSGIMVTLGRLRGDPQRVLHVHERRIPVPGVSERRKLSDPPPLRRWLVPPRNHTRYATPCIIPISCTI
jgi:hypothetical protein